jgi:hypothetical protein
MNCELRACMMVSHDMVSQNGVKETTGELQIASGNNSVSQGYLYIRCKKYVINQRLLVYVM